VNALSGWLIAEVKRDGKKYVQKFKKGIPETELEVVGTTKDTGTTISFKPDDEIFEDIIFNFETLEHRLREMAFLNKGIKIILEDKRHREKEEFHYEGGIKAFVEYVNRNKTPIHKEIVYFEIEKEGRTHLSGFRSALTRTINDYSRRNNFLKEKEDNFQGDDIREGLTAILSVKLLEPQFEGQTKTKLGNSEVRSIVDSLVSEELDKFLEENPNPARISIEKALQASRAREAARKAREISRKRSILDNTTLPGKLADCQSNDSKITEIFIVEGDSAGGSAKQGREREYQAILPLKGKIMNVEKARLDRILGFEEIKAMITAFGVGIGSEFDISKLRYGKIIIMTDADVDGAHIRTLLLTFFYRYTKELLENGHIYIAQPPLYKISKGRAEHYVYSDNELEEIVKDIGDSNYSIQRYKGLGEMNPEQLWETTMDPSTRTLLKVSIEDAMAADEIFTTLMGDKVKPRREFIQKNAKLVKNLDV